MSLYTLSIHSVSNKPGHLALAPVVVKYWLRPVALDSAKSIALGLAID